VAQQALRGRDEAESMGQLRVPVKGGFIRPFGVDREHYGLPDGLKHAYGAAATLGARGFDNAQKLSAKLHSDIRRWLKTDEEVDRHVDLLKPVWQDGPSGKRTPVGMLRPRLEKTAATSRYPIPMLAG